MKRLALCLLGLAIVPTAFAQELDGEVNLNLTITQPSYAACDDPAFDNIDPGTCTELASGPGGANALIWVVVSRSGGFGNGIGGVQFGATHSGVIGWTLCTGGSEIPEAGWPDSGFGNAATWGGGCYNSAGENARVGAFILPDGANGNMEITRDPRITDTQWTDCDTSLFTVCDENLGAAFYADGTTPICQNNCDIVPVQETTWSEIKASF